MIHLRHPQHGVKIAYMDAEANADKLNGWEEYVPTSETEALAHAQAEDESAPSKEGAPDACPKCGKAFKRGLTMHIRHCK